MFSKSARKRKSEKNAAGKTAQRSAGSEEDVSETSDMETPSLLRRYLCCGRRLASEETNLLASHNNGCHKTAVNYKLMQLQEKPYSHHLNMFLVGNVA